MNFGAHDAAADRDEDKHDDGVTLATIKFAWADDKPGEVTIKPVSTILVGATPEFEVAALSLAFLCGEQEGDNRTEAVWKSTSELGTRRWRGAPKI